MVRDLERGLERMVGSRGLETIIDSASVWYAEDTCAVLYMERQEQYIDGIISN